MLAILDDLHVEVSAFLSCEHEVFGAFLAVQDKHEGMRMATLLQLGATGQFDGSVHEAVHIPMEVFGALLLGVVAPAGDKNRLLGGEVLFEDEITCCHIRRCFVGLSIGDAITDDGDVRLRIARHADREGKALSLHLGAHVAKGADVHEGWVDHPPVSDPHGAERCGDVDVPFVLSSLDELGFPF